MINTMNLFTMIPGIREPPNFFTADPERTRASIRKLCELRPSLICVGHGPPLRDLSKLERRFVAKLPAD